MVSRTKKITEVTQSLALQLPTEWSNSLWNANLSPVRRAPEGTSKYPHILRLLGISDLYRENFEILLRKDWLQHRVTCCGQIWCKLAAEKWVERCVVTVTKIEKMSKIRFSCHHFGPVGPSTPKFFRTACDLDLHASTEFCRDRFRFAGVIAEKVDFSKRFGGL